MPLKTALKRAIHQVIARVRQEDHRLHDIERFRFSDTADAVADLRDRYGYTGALASLYTQERESVVHKWHHYLPIYDRYFSPWRDRGLRFLEIGVGRGGSLSLWRRYFGDNATIFGVDVDPTCAAHDGVDASVRIGSQDDRDFLLTVVAEMGGVDIVIDDGSHQMDHIRASLETLFPLLNEGGLYVVEDLHTAYWKPWGGGYREKSNFFNDIRDLIDDMHSWYHDRGTTHGLVSDSCTAIHIFDSMCILEKGTKQRPVHSSQPRSA